MVALSILTLVWEKYSGVPPPKSIAVPKLFQIHSLSLYSIQSYILEFLAIYNLCFYDTGALSGGIVILDSFSELVACSFNLSISGLSNSSGVGFVPVTQ